MIYSSYSEITREQKYAQQYIGYAKDKAYRYLEDVVREVGTIGIVLNSKPALLSRNGEHVLLYEKIDKGSPIQELTYEELMDVCEQVHGLHLVQEYGEESNEQS